MDNTIEDEMETTVVLGLCELLLIFGLPREHLGLDIGVPLVYSP